MGAASDHLFGGLLTADTADRLEVAIRYHQLYAILIFCLALYNLHAPKPQPGLKVAACIFSIGITLFSGSLYLSLVPGLNWTTALTPIGGLTIMAGWLSCMIAFFRSPPKENQ